MVTLGQFRTNELRGGSVVPGKRTHEGDQFTREREEDWSRRRFYAAEG
jgi:hypothetical protein